MNRAMTTSFRHTSVAVLMAAVIAVSSSLPAFAAERSRGISLLRDGRLAVFPGTHHLHMEDPATVAAAIGNFYVD